MKRRTKWTAVLVVAIFLPLFAALPAEPADSAESEKRLASTTFVNAGEYFGRTAPEYMHTSFAKEWSTEAVFDLTAVADIPSSAVVTGIVINAGRTTGHFSRPTIVVFDEQGNGFYVHDMTRKTDRHNGKNVKQRWTVAFRTEVIWQGPAKIWPYVTIYYEY